MLMAGMVEVGRSMSQLFEVHWINRGYIDVVASPYSESYAD